MKVIVANLGSTSYKYSLFDEQDAVLTVVAEGKYERVENHGEVIEDSLRQLVEQGHLKSIDDLDAVGFKAVMGGAVTGCLEADQNVLSALDKTQALAPAHNPVYADGIRLFSRMAPKATLVALFETAFFQWGKEASKRYAIPSSWYDAGVRRYGFHGASHKYIAQRSAELLQRQDVAKRVENLYHGELLPVDGQPLRVISCHLGGSSSVVGILNGLATGSSFGLSPQSGLPQNNRVGDLDAMAIPFALKEMGLSIDEIETQLNTQSGLLGLSGGHSNDLRDLREAAASGNADAQLAIDFLVYEIRRWASSYLFELGGLDAFVFTAGIGENNPFLRQAVCSGLEAFGLVIDEAANNGNQAVEGIISAPESKVKVMVIPANEEKVVATETCRYIKQKVTNV